jgi:hypothetical protein
MHAIYHIESIEVAVAKYTQNKTNIIEVKTKNYRINVHMRAYGCTNGWSKTRYNI